MRRIASPVAIANTMWSWCGLFAEERRLAVSYGVDLLVASNPPALTGLR